jgi:hypothetical protein
MWSGPQHGMENKSAEMERTAFPDDHLPQAPAQDFEDGAATRTSRLSGLRNLLFVLGVKDTQEQDTQEQDTQRQVTQKKDAQEQDQPEDLQHGGATSFNRRQEGDHYQCAVLESDEDAARSLGGASPGLVTAPPEFLSPKVVEFKNAVARAGDSTTRQDRRATADGVDILPSKRGQYKRL